ncbi:MAG TPA: GGDEF domain-containing protein, partial [Ktedonobacterales bacterium]|nr:GGDEF domain-containing protein [Ktedonobacterales bacterium]
SQIERITMLQQLERQRAAGLLALRDALTGLPNRRAFDDAVEAGIARAASDSHALALIFADVDHFKSVNDHFGHDIGDAVLRLVATRLSRAVGDAGVVFRLGGEEMVTLLPNTDGKAALSIAERLRQAVRADILTYETGLDDCHIDLPPDLHITASFGVAVYPTDAANAAELLKRADTAMYHAKRTGRDRVSAARAGDDQ